MHNDILTLGPLTVHGYGLMIGVGIVAALCLSWRRAKNRGLSQETVTSLFLWVLLFGFLGAKLLFLITELPAVLQNPLSYLGADGFVVYGGIISGVLAVWLWCWKKGQSMAKWADLLLPGVALAQGFGRIGCFLAGCCYGRPTDSCLGVVFPAGSLAPAGIPLLPTVTAMRFPFTRGAYAFRDNSAFRCAGISSILSLAYSCLTRTILGRITSSSP